MAGQTVFIKHVRCAHPSLTVAQAFEDGAIPKYSISFIIPKKNKELLKEVEGMIKKSAESAGVKETLKKTAIKQALDYNEGLNKFCIIKDGDILNQKRMDKDKDPYDYYKDAYVVKLSRPESFGICTVKDQSNAYILPADIKSKILPGYVVNIAAEFRFYVNKKSGEPGISGSLKGVQLVKKDEVFGERIDFDVEEKDPDETDDEQMPF